MLTDGPVTVSVHVTVIHFVAIREMSEVRSDKCFFYHIMFCPLLKFQTSKVKTVLWDQPRSFMELL